MNNSAHTIDYSMLPVHAVEGAKRYVEKGTPPGSFMSAVFCNDFVTAFVRADIYNQMNIGTYVAWLVRYAPAACYGSHENFKAWVESGGLEGIAAAAASGGAVAPGHRGIANPVSQATGD